MTFVPKIFNFLMGIIERFKISLGNFQSKTFCDKQLSIWFEVTNTSSQKAFGNFLSNSIILISSLSVRVFLSATHFDVGSNQMCR